MKISQISRPSFAVVKREVSDQPESHYIEYFVDATKSVFFLIDKK